MWRSLVVGALVGFGAVAPACAQTQDGGAGQGELDASRTLSSDSSPDTTMPPTTESTTTTTLAPNLDLDGVARALITTTNVVLPVLDAVADGWVVRTPCQEVVFVTDGTPIDRVHVVIDPGHGGSEPGAVTADGTSESGLNLEVANRVAALLGEIGFSTVLTRYDDYRLPIASRVEIADTLEAGLLISIHHQGLGDVPLGPAPGTEIYYQRPSAESKRFAGLLHEESLSELGRYDIEWFVGPDAGATYRPSSDTGDDFYGILRRPQTPAVLAEMSFMGNASEIELLKTAEFREAEARAIRNAVVRWFSSDDSGSGFVEPSFGLSSSGGGGGLGNCNDPDLGPLGELPPGSVAVESGSG